MKSTNNLSQDFPNPEFAEKLVSWFRANQRVLPWRDRQDDPYAVWISEIMLQQTTVSAVIGFYNRWMERFPTVESVANASVDEILRAWAGLGYYSRARNIRRTAEIIAGLPGVQFPKSVDELINLPGIGRYTAGAISSIAFNQKSPILDVNVVRVLSRVHGIVEDAKIPTIQKKLWEYAKHGIPDDSPRDFNQGLMELGALICTSANPRCSDCPVSKLCVAYSTGAPERFPVPKPKKRWKNETHVSLGIIYDKRILLLKRPDSGVWAGLWEMPRIVAETGADPAPLAERLKEIIGIPICTPVKFVGSFNHVVMDIKIKLIGYILNLAHRPESISPKNRPIAWVSQNELANYAIATPHKKLILIAFDHNQSQQNLAF